MCNPFTVHQFLFWSIKNLKWISTYFSLSIAIRLACPSYPVDGKITVVPCTAMTIPPPTEPKQWYSGTGKQIRTFFWKENKITHSIYVLSRKIYGEQKIICKISMLNNELYFCKCSTNSLFTELSLSFDHMYPPSSCSLCACRWNKRCSQCCDETEWLLWAFQLFP